MHVHLTEHLASGVRFAAPRLLAYLTAYLDESTDQPILNASGLRVPILIEVGERIGSPPNGARIRLNAKEYAWRYPVFEGTLRVVPITALDSTLLLEGDYEVPLGLIGRLADRTLLRTIAERSLVRMMAQMKAALSAAILESVMGKVG
jgi:hypothetical protein